MLRLGDEEADLVMVDPRLSKAQREAMRAAYRADQDACVEGLDQKLRPVLRMQLGVPRREVRYALLRNGNPTPVTGLISERWD